MLWKHSVWDAKIGHIKTTAPRHSTWSSISSLTAKLPLILVIQQRIFRRTHAPFGSTMTMITCVIIVIVHTITGWVSHCLFKSLAPLACLLTAVACANTVKPRASLLCALGNDTGGSSVCGSMWGREACVYAVVVWTINKKGREMAAVSLWGSKNVKSLQLIFQRDRDWFSPGSFLVRLLISRGQQASARRRFVMLCQNEQIIEQITAPRCSNAASDTNKQTEPKAG